MLCVCEWVREGGSGFTYLCECKIEGVVLISIPQLYLIFRCIANDYSHNK